jgi:uncharacterized SAM-binding protein YcdF (DUF218 family)
LRAADTRRRPRPRTRGHWAPPHGRSRLGWIGRSIAFSVAVVLGLTAWAVLARAFAPRSNTSLDHFDVLIVLGNPADDDGNPSPIQLARVTEAVREYERGVAPRMILTGGQTHDKFVEAKVMARTAEAQGIPASVILEEPQARNTIENTCYSFRIMRSHGWQSAEVISSPSHLPRTALILSRLPLEWRVHAAAPLGSESIFDTVSGNALEILKTIHYLVWSRQMEPCAL